MSSHSAGRHTGTGWLDKNRQWLSPPPPGTGLILIADTAAGNFQNNLQLQPCLPALPPLQIRQLFPPPPCLVPRHPPRSSSSIDNMDRRIGLWFAESEDPISPPLCVWTCRWERGRVNTCKLMCAYKVNKATTFFTQIIFPQKSELQLVWVKVWTYECKTKSGQKWFFFKGWSIETHTNHLRWIRDNSWNYSSVHLSAGFFHPYTYPGSCVFMNWSCSYKKTERNSTLLLLFMVSIWRLFFLVFIKDVHIVIVDIATIWQWFVVILLYTHCLILQIHLFNC